MASAATASASATSGPGSLSDAKVVRRELAGIPKVEVVGLSKEKVEEPFWDTVTQVRADLTGSAAEVVSTSSAPNRRNRDW
jgi:hypothetical protein